MRGWLGMKQPPVVTVGIPTFNRPAGLRDTLHDMCGQTYPHLRIVVGDNASSNPEVNGIIKDFAARDPRVAVYRHSENIGAGKNFEFLLRHVDTDFFMWAADDDRHDKDFVRLCMDRFRDSNASLATVMTAFRAHYHGSDTYTATSCPHFSPDDSLRDTLIRHLRTPVPSLIYGIHRTAAIRSCIPPELFDWSDCYLFTALLVNGWRIATLPQYLGYTAGIAGSEYTPKPALPQSGGVFRYSPYLAYSMAAIRQCPHLTTPQKLEAILAVCEFSTGAFVQWEHKHRPIAAMIHRWITWPSVSTARAAMRLVS
jgi:glycosyltransferase involved in cell wall biosynthesis